MLFFLYGEDTFRSTQKLKAIKDKFILSDATASGLSVFNYDETRKRESLSSVLGTGNLLAPKRLVIIKELLSKGTDEEQEELMAYLKKNQESLISDKDLVVVFWEEEITKKTNALFKWLEKNAKSQECKKITGLKLNQWITERLKELNAEYSIAPSALQKLVLYAGSDMFLLENEIQKLANFSSGKIINEEMVELLVKANLDSNIFNTVDALGNRNKREALKLLHRHLGQGEDPFYIFSMFIYQFRNLLKIADLKENRGMNEGEIAKESKVHPYVVKKSLSQLNNFSYNSLKKIYQKLVNLDLKIKTGKMDIKLALDKFIVEL